MGSVVVHIVGDDDASVGDALGCVVVGSTVGTALGCAVVATVG